MKAVGAYLGRSASCLERGGKRCPGARKARGTTGGMQTEGTVRDPHRGAEVSRGHNRDPQGMRNGGSRVAEWGSEGPNGPRWSGGKWRGK